MLPWVLEYLAIAMGASEPLMHSIAHAWPLIDFPKQISWSIERQFPQLKQTRSAWKCINNSNWNLRLEMSPLRLQVWQKVGYRMHCLIFVPDGDEFKYYIKEPDFILIENGTVNNALDMFRVLNNWLKRAVQPYC
jgi:hypothetical protein